MNGKITFTSKTHDHFTTEIFESAVMPGAKRLTVSEDFVSGFYGFGVAITPSSCYELSLMDKDERAALLRHIYGKEGLGLSVGRICVGSSDYSPELYSYDEVENDLALEHFSVSRDERYILPIIKEIVAINPDIYLFASPWSPPYWMKTGGRMCGGYMRDGYVDCYAEYIVKFIKAYAEHGIKISALTPQNEANTQQKGCMPACIWHPETEAKFIMVLREKLLANGLDVKIWMYDHNFEDVNRVLWSLRSCEGLRKACDGVAFHYYTAAIEQTLPVKREFPDMELHFTEGGPRLTENYDTDWCKWGLMIAKAVKVGYRSFTGWNLMLNELGGPNIGPFIGICGGFVTHDRRTESLLYSGQYKAYKHIAPYVTPASKLRYVVLDEIYDLAIGKFPKQHDFRVEGVLIENPDGKTVAVLINPNADGVQTQIEIGGKLWYAELQPDSISTIEIG